MVGGCSDRLGFLGHDSAPAGYPFRALGRRCNTYNTGLPWCTIICLCCCGTSNAITLLEFCTGESYEHPGQMGGRETLSSHLCASRLPTRTLSSTQAIQNTRRHLLRHGQRCAWEANIRLRLAMSSTACYIHVCAIRHNAGTAGSKLCQTANLQQLSCCSCSACSRACSQNMYAHICTLVLLSSLHHTGGRLLRFLVLDLPTLERPSQLLQQQLHWRPIHAEAW